MQCGVLEKFTSAYLFQIAQLLVGDDWYLNLNSTKRPPGRNLGEHRSVRRSGTTSRGAVVLEFCLRMRIFLKIEVYTTFLGKSVRVGSTEEQ